MNFFILIIYIFFFLPLNPVSAFDMDYGGYIKTGSQYIFDSPSLHKDFDSDLQIHLGLDGNVLNKNKWALDYEMETEASYVDGPSEQSKLRPETDFGLHRAWLRLNNDSLQFRGGRQEILFGDGVIFNTGSMNEVRQALVYLGSKSFELSSAKIIEIQEVGDGERVCVDTASMLNRGEGMLIGSRANFLFLVHNESVGSSFTSPRPFRVNAGAVHCYTLAPDGTTKYLSELETGVEILVLDSKGKARRATIGRCKIEKRPMLMIKAKVGEEIGGIIAQDAETIRFVKPNGHLVSVTHLKKGDSVLVHSKAATGRHFGMEISDEYILEK